jgi:hypothetical protein
VVVSSAETGKRCHDQTVGECVGSNLERLKELGLRYAAHVGGMC